MTRESLIEIVNGLTPEEQVAVRAFIDFLKHRPTDSPFLQAVDEFIDEHPELLQRLAK